MLALAIAAVAVGWALLRIAPPLLARAGARDAWRPGAAAAAIAALAGAGFTAVRGEWAEALVLLLVAVSLAVAARRRARRPQPRGAPGRPGMSRREAAAMLGVDEAASTATVQAAYARLMKRAHPDQGGTSGLAAQLNLARWVLLDGDAVRRS